MNDFRLGYLYSLAPIHCGGEGDLGNILEIAREIHTDFPYIPGSSLRGSLRNEVLQYKGKTICDRLFGRELTTTDPMGVHQVWFGDARLLWVPMRTLSLNGNDVFSWVSCHSLIRDHGILSKQSKAIFPDNAVGSSPGKYTVADATVDVGEMSPEQKLALAFAGGWCQELGTPTHRNWEKNRIVLPDGDFQVLMEHSLWTQVRNKIKNDSNATDAGAAEVFWTDVCIPRDTIFYYGWGYNIQEKDPVTTDDSNTLNEVLSGLIQVGGQANVGRGWVQSWIANKAMPTTQQLINKGV
jgi:CRISPR-associated protein Cmr4